MMKTTMMLLFGIIGFASALEAEAVKIHDPLFTLSGHYQSRDGRVIGHRFPVKLKLHADGTVAGTFESWMELRFADGRSQLSYPTEKFSGTWKLKGRVVEILVEGKDSLPLFQFKELNGIKVSLKKRKNS